MNDFVVVGETISRPKGVSRWFTDLVCRLTGHLLWRSKNSQYKAPTGALYHTSHCRRCWRWGYVQDDHWPTTVVREFPEGQLRDLVATELRKLFSSQKEFKRTGLLERD